MPERTIHAYVMSRKCGFASSQLKIRPHYIIRSMHAKCQPHVGASRVVVSNFLILLNPNESIHQIIQLKNIKFNKQNYW